MSDVVHFGRPSVRADGKPVRDMRKKISKPRAAKNKLDKPELAKHNLIHVTSGSINRSPHRG